MAQDKLSRTSQLEKHQGLHEADGSWEALWKWVMAESDERCYDWYTLKKNVHMDYQ